MEFGRRTGLATASRRLPRMVIADSYTNYGGSMDSNSPAIGDWETSIARELVDHISTRS